MDIHSPRLVVAMLCVISGVPFQGRAIDVYELTFNGRKATVCCVDPAKDKLGLFLNDSAGQPLKSFTALSHWLETQDKRLVFAMNAGMFEANYTPVGLFISDSRQLAPINLRNASGNFYLKPNGVFAVTGSGAVVVESSEFQFLSGPVILATQSGPLLMRNGRINPAFQPRSTSRLFRNGVGIASPGMVFFAITDEPMNFYEFAAFFRDGLHCKNALFLDGTVSSLYAPSLGRNDRKIDLGPMIGVVQ